MKIRLPILLICFILPALAFSQHRGTGKGKAIVIVIGKPMTSLDSTIVQQLFFSALREKTVENFSLASDLFNRVLQTDPANDAAMYELANLNKLNNNYVAARGLLEKAVTVKPDNEWYWVALADCYEKNNEITKLENVFNELTRINPDNPDYYFDSANAYFLEGKYDQALAEYKKAQQITGLTDDLLIKRQKIYLKQGKVDQAAADLNAAIANNPGEIKYYLLLGELYNANGFPDKALTTLQSAEKINTGNGQVHLSLADLYRDKKDYEASFNELTLAFAIPELEIDQKIKIVLGYIPKFPNTNAKQSALELSRILTVAHPDDSKAFALYGDMQLQNNKIKEAKVSFKKSLSLNDKVYEVQEQLIRIDLGENDIDGAIKDGENALSLFPNQAWLNYFVGVAWLQKKDYKKALSYLKNVTSLEAQDRALLSITYSSIGDCYHNMNDLKGSFDAYDKSLGYNSDNAFTLNNYAYYLSEKGESLDKAAAMSKHANELQPNTASFEDTYAWILFRQKNYAEARIWMEKALLHDKDHSAVEAEHYGDIMFHLGDTEAAVLNWKKAKQYGGGSAVLERKINEKKYSE